MNKNTAIISDTTERQPHLNNNVNTNISNNEEQPQVNNSVALVVTEDQNTQEQPHVNDKNVARGLEGDDQNDNCQPAEETVFHKSSATDNNILYNSEYNMEAPLFLRKLRQILNECVDEIVGWSEDGTMIVIRDEEKFCKKVIPEYFENIRFSSFKRQLNNYGFRNRKLLKAPFKKNSTKDEIVYHNECFHRDKPELMKHIVRQRTPNSKPPANFDNMFLDNRTTSSSHLNGTMVTSADFPTSSNIVQSETLTNASTKSTEFKMGFLRGFSAGYAEAVKEFNIKQE